MNTPKRDLVIFTGQSGIKLENCINKLKRSGLNYQLVAVDKAIPEISGMEFVDVLGAPPAIQEILWARTFKQLHDALQSKSTKNDFTFLTFHACYYHQKKTEFVCPVDLNQLIQLKERTKMVIVLIDDCYDIYRRLMDKGQMYEDFLSSDDSLDTLIESICNITNLLTWREIEIAFSRKIARLLDVPMYLISVKHPDFIISRLISAPEESLKILYLSHPISVLRKQVSSSRLLEFYADLSSFIRDVLKPDNVVLFIPDAIDEYRIEQEKQNDGSTLYMPKLLTRWPLTFTDQLLYEQLPSRLESVNPLNPGQYKYTEAIPDAKSAVSSSLRLFNDTVHSQVNSRDLTLVEQSRDGVLVYRPYLAASAHSGVESEIRYNSDLRDQYSEKERRTYIITTEEDLGKLRIKKLFTLVEDSVNITEKKYKDSLKELCEQWLVNPTKVSEFYHKSYDIDDTIRVIEELLPQGYMFIKYAVDRGTSPLSAARMLQKSEQRKRGWIGVFEQVAAEDPLVGYSGEKDVLLSSSDNYDREVETFIQDVIANKSSENESRGG